MKKIIILFIVLLIASFLIGCGKDGDDGSAYISINWLYNPLYYTDDNSATPEQGYNGQYYKTSPGTYNFSYTSWDNSTWSGTYTITIEEGEEGDIFFQNGEDGDDKYFELYCYSTGPSYSNASVYGVELSLGSNAGIAESDKSTSTFNSDTVDNPILHSSDSDSVVLEQHQGSYKLRIEYKKVSSGNYDEKSIEHN